MRERRRGDEAAGGYRCRDLVDRGFEDAHSGADCSEMSLAIGIVARDLVSRSDQVCAVVADRCCWHRRCRDEGGDVGLVAEAYFGSGEGWLLVCMQS